MFKLSPVLILQSFFQQKYIHYNQYMHDVFVYLGIDGYDVLKWKVGIKVTHIHQIK